MYVTTDSLGRSEIHDGEPSYLSAVPPEYRDAYKHANSLARARESNDEATQAAESKWLVDQGWTIQLPNPKDTFKAILISHSKLPKKIRVNVMS
jgi:hypothetical protein